MNRSWPGDAVSLSHRHTHHLVPIISSKYTFKVPDESETCCRAFFSPLFLLLLFPYFPVKCFREKKCIVDGCFLLEVYVNVPLGIFFSLTLAKWNLFSPQLHGTIKETMCCNLLGLSRAQPWLNSPPGEESGFQGLSYMTLSSLQTFSHFFFVGVRMHQISQLQLKMLLNSIDVSFLRIASQLFFF